MDPYESFVTRSSLFERAGDMCRTRPSRSGFFHPATFSAAPSDATFRIFVFGGSVTYGYALANPESESYCSRLRALLQAELPAREVEVINCGGICYASYRLLSIAEECLAYDADLFVVMMGHNEFLEPRHYGSLMAAGRTVPFWQRMRLVQVFQDLGGRLTASDSEFLTEPVLAAEYIGEQYIVRDEEEFTQTLRHYGWNIQRILDRCEARGVPVVLCTLPSNLRNWPPFESLTSPGADKTALDARLRQSVSLLKDGRHAEALAQARVLAAEEPGAAAFHYVTAMCLDAAGKTREAKQEYLVAKDLDAFPHRAPSTFNMKIRELADGGAPLFDAERLFELRSPDGIPGRNLFLDQCHPNPAGHELLADGLAELILSAYVQ